MPCFSLSLPVSRGFLFLFHTRENFLERAKLGIITFWHKNTPASCKVWRVQLTPPTAQSHFMRFLPPHNVESYVWYERNAESKKTELDVSFCPPPFCVSNISQDVSFLPLIFRTRWVFRYFLHIIFFYKQNKENLSGPSPRANYTYRTTVASRRSYCQLLWIVGCRVVKRSFAQFFWNIETYHYNRRVSVSDLKF
jgi:hypothetical protein